MACDRASDLCRCSRSGKQLCTGHGLGCNSAPNAIAAMQACVVVIPTILVQAPFSHLLLPCVSRSVYCQISMRAIATLGSAKALGSTRFPQF